MNKVIGICVLAAAAVGLVVVAKKYAKKCQHCCNDDYPCGCDTFTDSYDELYDTVKSKSDAVFEQAVKSLDDMKSVVTDFCGAVKEIVTQNPTEQSSAQEPVRFSDDESDDDIDVESLFEDKD